MEGRFLCQWDKDSCDDARFVKIDFLALGMLSLVEECLELIVDSRQDDRSISAGSISTIQAIYDMICAGDTIGVFQIESRAQIQMLPRTRPRESGGSGRPGRDRPPRPDHRRRGQSLRRAPPARTHQLPADRAALRPSAARTGAGGDARRHPLPGAGARGGDGAGRLHRRAGRGFRRAMSRKRSREAMTRSGTHFRDGAERQGCRRSTRPRQVFTSCAASPSTASRRRTRPPSPCWPISRAGCGTTTRPSSSARCSTTSRWASTPPTC